MAKGRAGTSKRPGSPSFRVVSGGRNDEPDRGTATRSKGRASGRRTGAAAQSRGKRVTFDIETWQTLDLLARDRMMTFQELADEAFRDLLRKHGRPVDLKDALKRSARDSTPPRDKGRGRR